MVTLGMGWKPSSLAGKAGEPEQIIERQYTGESSRTLRIRAQQHREDYNRCMRQTDKQNIEEGTSFMFDHHKEVHSNDVHDPINDFNFSVIDTFKDPLTRQLNEAIRIQHSMKGIHTDLRGKKHPIVNLNRKIEYFAPRKRRWQDEP